MDDIKQGIIKLVNDDKYNPMTFNEILIKLELDNSSEFKKLIDDMVKEMYIIITKKDRIISPNQAGIIVGKFISHRKGFGFIQSDKEDMRDLYIPSKNVGNAIHGDRVMAEITKEASGYKRAEGKVVQIKEYGAFVELEPGLDGLVHISEVANKRVTNIAEELEIGQAVAAKILEIDTERKRISLSIKQAMEAEAVEADEE